VAAALRRVLRPRESGKSVAPLSVVRRVAIDVAIFLWGVGYLCTSLDDPMNASRIFDGDIFGSIVPVAILLNWIVLCLFVLVIATFLAKVPGWLQNFGSAAVSLALAALLGEAWVRGVAWFAPVPQAFPTSVQVSWFYKYARLNSLGFRDREHNLVADSGVRRLLLLGDSYAYGVGVNDAQSRFADLLQAKLERETSSQWELINASFPDRHTLQELEILRCTLPYNADLVVLLYVFNDIDYLRTVVSRPALAGAPSGIAERLSPLRLAFMNSYLFQEIYVRVRAKKRYFAPEVKDDPYNDAELLGRHIGDLTQFANTARSHGAAMVVVPFDIAVQADSVFQYRYSSFIQAARAARLPVLSLEKAFSGNPFNTLTVSSLDGHPNALANKLASDAVAAAIAALVPAKDAIRRFSIPDTSKAALKRCVGKPP